ncbi:hypothetical protein HR11_07495 [Porphyromonas macacae]|uniref:radical SAM family heme chaperone HemW n=1 Tax=Porphyromonas macacae TaxID=28115 RepID=UPI00052E0511|nr:radical SAM family heme chaperone HemW [Porphyromonas macacae]KGO00034.1 hypothetical protein HR11_07495 [Porphyromonas macacae]
MNLYIHVPFCVKKCAYCDFYSLTDQRMADAYVDALCHELILRHEQFASYLPFQNIYFGGGTPSQLKVTHLKKIFNCLERFGYDANGEITFEANPDDLHENYVRILNDFPINRISMGVQSFDDSDLSFLGRRHNVKRVYDAISTLHRYGFHEISIDLIYGLPGQTLSKWNLNIDQALALHLPHISAYHLIYEPHTVLTRKLEQGRIEEVNEETSVGLFRLLIRKLQSAGYRHYEISNFAIPGHEAKLNSGYWFGALYTGIGPSAHSYMGEGRSFNVADLHDYIKSLSQDKLPSKTEFLSITDQYNEYVMTRLRTDIGIDLDELKKNFGKKKAESFLYSAKRYTESGLLSVEGSKVRLTQDGIFVSDGIIADLFAD